MNSRIDEKTFGLEIGLFAWVLVDVNLACRLLERILVKWKDMNFFVSIVYEKLSELREKCGTIGHVITRSRKQREEVRQNGCIDNCRDRQTQLQGNLRVSYRNSREEE